MIIFFFRKIVLFFNSIFFYTYLASTATYLITGSRVPFPIIHAEIQISPCAPAGILNHPPHECWLVVVEAAVRVAFRSVQAPPEFVEYLILSVIVALVREEANIDLNSVLSVQSTVLLLTRSRTSVPGVVAVLVIVTPAASASRQ